MVYHIDEWHFAYFYTTRNEGVYYLYLAFAFNQGK